MNIHKKNEKIVCIQVECFNFLVILEKEMMLKIVIIIIKASNNFFQE